MCCSEDSLLVDQPVCDSFIEILSEVLIVLDDLHSHKPNNSSEMSVASLGNLAETFVLSCLVARLINPFHGDDLPMTQENSNISSHLGQKIRGRLLPYSPDGSKNFNVFLHLSLTLFYKHLRELLQMIFQLHEDQGLLLKDHCFRGTRCPYGCGCGLHDRLDSLILVPSMRGPYQDLCDLGSFGFMDSFSRGIAAKQSEHGFGEDPSNLLQFGKGDRENSLEIAFDCRHLIQQAFPLPRKVP